MHGVITVVGTRAAVSAAHYVMDSNGRRACLMAVAMSLCTVDLSKTVLDIALISTSMSSCMSVFKISILWTPGFAAAALAMSVGAVRCNCFLCYFLLFPVSRFWVAFAGVPASLVAFPRPPSHRGGLPSPRPCTYIFPVVYLYSLVYLFPWAGYPTLTFEPFLGYTLE